jgi:phosphoribosylaminoimidazole-succinocarboxamide synthase
VDLRQALTSQLSRTLARTDFPALGARYEGKVRDNYVKDGRRYLISTDRVSAFDRVLGTIPGKGQLLNEMAAWWFDQTRDLCPNHLLEIPDPQVMVARELRPLPIEVIVRGYLTGVTSTSIWTHYARGLREYAGHKLADGMVKHQKLPKALVTPSTKAEKGEHDETISRAEALSRGLVTAKEFDALEERALALFAKGTKIARDRGLILVDTKYEFGRDEKGEITLMDEIHTPDSSRYWYSRTYEDRMKQGGDPDALDKEFLRRYLVSVGYTGEGAPPVLPDDIRVEAGLRYAQTFELLTGKAFAPVLGDPLARMQKNLALLGGLRSFKVFVTPRKGVLDPQGEAVAQSLSGLGFAEVRGVRVGRYIEVSVEERDAARAAARVEEMCKRLLTNPIIEDFTIEPA